MKDDELLRRFLLGELEDGEAQRLEARLLEEDELFELCDALEAELLDALERGELSPAERDRVRKRLASSRQGRARLALARDLAAFADGKLAPAAVPARLAFPHRPALTARPAVRWAMAAGLLVLLAGTGTWILTRPEDEGQIVRQELPRKPAGRGSSGGTVPLPPAPPAPDPVVEETLPETQPVPAPARPEPSREVVTPEPPPRAEPEVFVLSLLTRRDEAKPEEIRIPTGKEHIAFHVDVTEEDFQSFDAVVKRADKEFLRESQVAPTRLDGGRILVLDLRASELPFGRYQVEVYGNSADGTQEHVRAGEIEVVGGG